MITVDLTPRGRGHVQRLVASLAEAGWQALRIPADGRLGANRQLIELRARSVRLRLRLNIYSVGDRGESHRRDERRIEITSTYGGGLARRAKYRDVVLGYDAVNDVYVGIDARRLEHGGSHHNASSSIERSVLENKASDRIVVLPHSTKLLGVEYQAVLPSKRLAEYLFNVDAIHEGTYLGGGRFSGVKLDAAQIAERLTVPELDARGDLLVIENASRRRQRPRVTKRQVEAFTQQNWRKLKDTTPEELEAIRRRCEEIGSRGELFVLQHEKERLRRAGHADLAAKVEWISRRAVGRGYDVRSFDESGAVRRIEVKASSRRGATFPMSDNEWRAATKYGEAYYLYRVIDVDTAPTLQRVVQNPVAAEARGELLRTPYGWKIRLH